MYACVCVRVSLCVFKGGQNSRFVYLLWAALHPALCVLSKDYRVLGKFMYKRWCLSRVLGFRLAELPGTRRGGRRRWGSHSGDSVFRFFLKIVEYNRVVFPLWMFWVVILFHGLRISMVLFVFFSYINIL